MDDTTAVVTGVSRGIDGAVARRFAAEGAHVICCARDGDALDELAEEMREASGDVTLQRADVRDEYDVEQLMETAARVGAIDLVVANAGVYHGPTGETPLETESYAAFDDHLRTNARGVFSDYPQVTTTSRRRRPTARPIGVARETRAGFGSYAVSKAAAEALVRGFAAELDHPGSRRPRRGGDRPHGPEGRDPDTVAEIFV